MNMNVFKDFPYGKKYYWTHPWKFFKECWINLKNSWMRATKGYCYADLWNMDDWFVEIFPRMLRHLAKAHTAYPGQPPFETSEKWEQWLTEMAENLEYAASDPEEENEYAEQFADAIDNCQQVRTENGGITYKLSDEDKELRDNYFNRHKELVSLRQEILKYTMLELGQYLHYLWD